MTAGRLEKRLVPPSAALLLLSLAVGCSKQLQNQPPQGSGGLGGGGFSGSTGTGGIDYSSCVSSGGGHPGAFGTDATATPGAPSFVQAPVISPGFLGIVASGDLNGDGLQDIVASSDVSNNNGIPAGNVAVWLNAGGGTFAPRVDYAVAVGASGALALGDLDGDGKVDVVVGGWTARIGVLKNAGAGQLATPAYYDVGGVYASLAIGDIDGDGTKDIIVANRRNDPDPNRNGDLAVLFNDAAGGFAPARHYPAGIEPGSVGLADVNGDGRVDVVTSGTCGGTLLLNGGNGTLTTQSLSTGVRGVMALRDVDGDGKPDIVFVDPWGQTGVLRSNGDGTFAPPAGPIVESPENAAVGDINGDGKVDLVVGTAYANHNLAVLLNDGQGGFGMPLNYAGTVLATSLVVADVSGDGLADVVTLGPDGLNVLVNGSH